MPNWCNNMLEVTGSPEAVSCVKKLVCFENEGQHKVDFEILVPMPEPLVGIDICFHGSEEDFKSYSIPKYHNGRLGQASFKGLKNALIGAGLSELFNADKIIEEAKELPIYKAGMAIEDFAEQAVRACKNYSDVAAVVRVIFDMLSQDNQAYCMAKYGHATWYDWSIANWGTKWNVEYESYLITDDARDFSVGFDTAWNEPDNWFLRLIDKLACEGIEADVRLTFGEGGVWFGGKHIYQDGRYSKEDMQDDELKEFLGIEDEDFEDFEDL